jgi:PadR family transcriptional regulator, regulatory protein PadR
MKADELRGHLDALILAVLEDESLHGYAIMEAIGDLSEGAIDLPTGTLYPALRRLERIGYLRSSWSTVSGRRRRTYQLTSAGKRALADERSAWHSFASVIGAVLTPRPDRA